MKTILVTGAAGYIGRHVVKNALDRGYRVIAADFNFKGVDERAEFCDVPLFGGDADLYRKLGSPDVCIHLAWRDGFRHNSAAHMKDLSSHVTFLNTLIDGGLKDLSVMGTMHEVGYWEGAINESTPCKPQSQYGIAKNALRQSMMLTLADSPCKLHWLRAYYITGDEVHGSSIFAKITQAEQDGKKTFPFTSGSNLYDFIDVDELANMIVAASVQEEINGIINVCRTAWSSSCATRTTRSSSTTARSRTVRMTARAPGATRQKSTAFWQTIPASVHNIQKGKTQ